MQEWNLCQSCDAEFKVLVDGIDNVVSYCPICGTELESFDEFDEDGDEDE